MCIMSSTGELEIVINECYGFFCLSDAALREYENRTSRTIRDDLGLELERHDPVLVQIVKDLGSDANGEHAKLSIGRIPSQYAKHYKIREYDGYESISIEYDNYRVAATKAILQDARLTKTERIARAVALLGADLERQRS